MEGEDRIEYNGIERKNSLECSLSCAHHDDCKTWHFFQKDNKCLRYRASCCKIIELYVPNVYNGLFKHIMNSFAIIFN